MKQWLNYPSTSRKKITVVICISYVIFFIALITLLNTYLHFSHKNPNSLSAYVGIVILIWKLIIILFCMYSIWDRYKKPYNLIVKSNELSATIWGLPDKKEIVQEITVGIQFLFVVSLIILCLTVYLNSHYSFNILMVIIVLFCVFPTYSLLKQIENNTEKLEYLKYMARENNFVEFISENMNLSDKLDLYKTVKSCISIWDWLLPETRASILIVYPELKDALIYKKNRELDKDM